MPRKNGGESRKRGRWVWVVGLVGLAAGLVSLSRDGSGTVRGPGSARVNPVVLQADEVALALGGANPVRVNPPIDVVEAERWASRIPLLNVPLPNERRVETWRLSGGIEVTQAVLYYDDAAEGARLESMAETLLSTGLGLEQTPLVLPGADSAIGWLGAGFVGASFRRGPFVALVGVTGPAPAGAEKAMAEAVLQKVEAALAAIAATQAAVPGATAGPSRETAAVGEP